jgi:hypothetical protein
LPERYPEQAIEAAESRARSFPFPDDELLAESHVLQTKPMTGEKEAPKLSHQHNHKRKHTSIFTNQNSLSYHINSILMTDTSPIHPTYHCTFERNLV